jgi:hypothetical protein
VHIESIYEAGVKPDTNNKKDNGNGNQTYQERNARNYNLAEDAFEALCADRGVAIQRTGFDEKNGKVPNFFRLNNTLRHLPDYVINYENKVSGETETRVIAVKGTDKFKQEDYNRLDWLEANFGSPRAPLYFVFYVRGKFHWRTPAEVKALYEASTQVGTWTSDNKEYRIIELGAN